MTELNKIALKILSNGKGILAADESNVTMTKRLKAVNVTSTPENRLLFRETLFSSESMKNCIGGVILYDETINQLSSSNKSIPDMISESGAIPGIKVDTGTKDLANSPKEKITEGLDGLRERLKEYYKLGARFTKWRGVYNISNNKINKVYSVAGGGDTVSLLNRLNAVKNFNFVSTAGGAFLEYLEGKQLPGITALNNLEK